MEEALRRPSLGRLRGGRRPACVSLLDQRQHASTTHRAPGQQSRRAGDMKIAEHQPAGILEAGPAGSRRHWAARINAALVPLVEIPAALIVVAEIVVLLAGILARYVFHKPIIWSDELAAILFLWLAMLGSVIAFQRGEHMRMTALVGLLKPRARAFLDVVAIAAPLAFLVLVLHPAYEYAADEVFVTTPALELANAWRAAALPVGIGLMILVAALRLARGGDWRNVAGALALAAAAIGGLVLLGP